MTEDIDLCLTTCGVILSFQNFDLYGIPGFETSMLYKGEATLYEVERQWFEFQVSTLAISEETVSLDDQFIMEDGIYQYTFSLNRLPIPDLTGFSKLHADFIGKVLL